MLIYVNLWDTGIKSIFFSACLFLLLTITGRNEAIIVELKALFLLNGTLSPFLGVPIIRFLAITKMMPALAFIFIIVATNA